MYILTEGSQVIIYYFSFSEDQTAQAIMRYAEISFGFSLLQTS